MSDFDSDSDSDSHRNGSADSRLRALVVSALVVSAVVISAAVISAVVVSAVVVSAVVAEAALSGACWWDLDSQVRGDRKSWVPVRFVRPTCQPDLRPDSLLEAN
jgi:hypothetical protein